MDDTLQYNREESLSSEI